jgi:hypothetical protein
MATPPISRGDAAALPKFASVSDLSQKTLSALKRVSSDLNAASLRMWDCEVQYGHGKICSLGMLRLEERAEQGRLSVQY